MASKAGSRGTPPLERRGSGMATFVRSPHQAGSNLPRSRRRCPVPPADDAWRFMAKWFCGNGFAWPAIATRFLSLRALRSRTALLQPGCRRQARLAPAPARQPPPPAESGRPARSSRPPAGIPPPPDASARDGSRFPFDHFPGIIRMWDRKCDSYRSSAAIQRRWAAPLAGNTARHTAVLPDLRPSRRVSSTRSRRIPRRR